MTVNDLCRRDVDTATYDQSALDAARCMRDRQVGSVVVVDDHRPVGILTDRDLTVRVLAAGLDPGTTRVSEVMTPSPTTVREDATIVDDVLAMAADELAQVGPLLRREAPHRWIGRQT